MLISLKVICLRQYISLTRQLVHTSFSLFKMKIWLVLLQYVMAVSRSYLFQWETLTNTTSDCNSAPNVVFAYDVSDPLKTNPASTERWPTFSVAYAPFYPNRTCGFYKQKVMTDYCCVSFLDPSSRLNISSVTEVNLPAPPAISDSVFPSFVENQQYCKLTNMGGFFGYKEFYMKPDGRCYDGYFRCTNSSLQIYQTINCNGMTLGYPISTAVSIQTHPYVNSFQLSLVNINGAKARIGYTTISPQIDLALGNGEPAEVIASISFAFVMLMELGLFCYFSFRYYKLRKFSGLVLAVAHFFWMLFLCIYVAYTYKTFAGRNDLNPVLASWSFFFGLANLVTALYTANFIAVFWNFDKLRSILLYSGVCVVNIGLMGSYYLMASIYLQPFVYTDYDKALEIWSSSVYNAWVLILFMWDTVPICVILGRAAFGVEGSWSTKVIASLKRDLISALMFCFQFPIAIAFLINEVVRNSTPLLGNDRNFQATRVFSVLFVTLHCLLNTVIIYRVAMRIQTSQISSSNKAATNSSKKPTSQPTTAQTAPTATTDHSIADKSTILAE